MGVRGASSKLKKAAMKMVVAACGSFGSRKPPGPVQDYNISDSTSMSPTKPNNSNIAESVAIKNNNNADSKNLCAICLEALSYSKGNSPEQAIFIAQCSHAFHLVCISSNVRHGSVTCPICRAHWTQLPRNLHPPCSLSCNQTDPFFQILDNSIATFRVHRRSFLCSAHYDDDDPIEPHYTPNHSQLDFSLLPIPPTLFHQCRHHLQTSYTCTSSNSRTAGAAYLLVKLTHQRATDLVLVASTNGPHLRLLKQSMALVVFSLRSIDRLAIVTYSSSAACVFPLKCMTSYGKLRALQEIDCLFYMGQVDPIEGLKKGIKILEDRAHKNPHSLILHLTDTPTRSYHGINMQVPVPIPIHQFHVGLGFTSNGFVIHEFKKFLAGLLGHVIQDVQLRIGEESRIIRLGELRSNDERRILLDLHECGHICIRYSYVEGGFEECTRTGETMVNIGYKSEASDDVSSEVSAGRDETIIGGRSSGVGSWDYHDPHMARRRAKHLHGYRL